MNDNYENKGNRPLTYYESSEPGHKNAEHYYSEQGDRPLTNYKSSEPGHKNAEHYYSEQGDRPVTYYESSEPGHKNAEHYYSEQGDRPVTYYESSEPGYKNAEHYYSEGFIERGGPNIDGKTPSELIENGSLTPENIKGEGKKVVYDDIMLGLTNDKNMLAKKIDLIISDKNVVNAILSNQYILAIQEMENEEKGFINNAPINRKFQFLATVKMLMEKGYDIDSFSFNKGDTSIGLAKLVAEFRKECTVHKAKGIEDPSWFKTGEPPQNHDTRKVNNPWLYAGTLIREIYEMKPQNFEAEYENYKETTKRPKDEMLPYEEFVYYTYGIEVPAKSQNLTLQQIGKETTNSFTLNTERAETVVKALEDGVRTQGKEEQSQGEKS